MRGHVFIPARTQMLPCVLKVRLIKSVFSRVQETLYAGAVLTCAVMMFSNARSPNGKSIVHSLPAVKSVDVEQERSSFGDRQSEMSQASVAAWGTVGTIASRSTVIAATGPFTQALQLPGGGAAAWGDYDQDGRLDLVIAGHYDGTTYASTIYRNLGNGVFASSDAKLIPVWGAEAAWGDIDNDGDLDLIIAGHAVGGPRCDVYRNDNGSFTNMQARLSGGGFAAVALGDYDNDGLLDVAIGGSNRAQLYGNVGNGFILDPVRLVGFQFGAMAWADIDNDGDLDLTIAGEYETGWGTIPIMRIYRNTEGVLEDGVTTLTPVAYSALAWADYDNDGDMDVAIAGMADSGPVTLIYRNDDNGVFTDIHAPLLGLTNGALAWGDYDNDGRRDLAVTGYFYDGMDRCATRVYHNDGNNTFVDVGASVIGVQYGTVAWGDYDNDGRLDLLVSGMTCDQQPITRVYHNNILAANTPPLPPSSMSAVIQGQKIVFSWSPGSDLQTPATGLTYNLRIGSSPGSDDILSAMADLNTGYRHLPSMGGMQQREWVIEQIFSPPYYWSVQSVDSGLVGSTWAEERLIAFHGILNRTRNTRHENIQAAINAAQPGDEIILAPGVYSGEGNRDLHFDIGDGPPIDLTIASIAPHNPWAAILTIIDCQGSATSPHRAFRFLPGQTSEAVLSGITIRNGYAPQEGTTSMGGAILCRQSNPTIANCRIINCHSDGLGGAIAYDGRQWQIRPAMIQNCTLTGNTATAGGAIAILTADCDIHNSLLAGNVAANGGSIYAEAPNGSFSTNLVNCVLDANRSSGYGGALYAQSPGTAWLLNSTMTNNTSSVGGGVYAYSAIVRLTNSIAWGNVDNSGTGEYAQIRVINGYPLAEHSCVQGWSGSMFGSTTIADDPLFVNPAGPDHDPSTWLDNDVRLTRLSPCVNGGEEGWNSEPLDFDGLPRVFNCYVDMGAYESQWVRPWADFDGDCHVDLPDVNHLIACTNGANGDPVSTECIDADLDLDGDVDGDDFALIQRCWSGPYELATAECMK